MAKSKQKTVYSCQNCGAQRSRWEGRCSDCGAWNSFVEESWTAPTASSPRSTWVKGASENSIMTLDQRPGDLGLVRWSTHLAEFDRVLGGGLVQGGFVLLGGAPGIGKSTLLMQMAGGLSGSVERILYVTAEESVDQTAHRAHRLGVRSEKISLLSESNMEVILQGIERLKPTVVIIDSIQTVFLPDLEAAPGSVSQVRECAARLVVLSKTQGISVVLIGHITKEGNLAGPKVLEHMVDTVLAFEGESSGQFRLLRTLKNRYGAAHELGVFAMAGQGLQEVLNPSELFLESQRDRALGSAVFASMEGTRPLLCEIQALAVPTPLPVPRRTSVGIELNRLHMLVAVMERHMGLRFFQQDIYLNVVGGLRVEEPAGDLAVLAALLSSQRDQELPSRSVLIGEVGLTGEVRPCAFVEARVKEAKKLGFKNIYLPSSNEKHLQDLSPGPDVRWHWISHVKELEQILFPKTSKVPQTQEKRSGNPGVNDGPTRSRPRDL